MVVILDSCHRTRNSHFANVILVVTLAITDKISIIFIDCGRKRVTTLSGHFVLIQFRVLNPDL